MSTKNLLLSTVVACLGSIQYGYHMAELNAPEKALSCNTNVSDFDSWFTSHGFVRCIPLSVQEIGFLTSIFSIGGLFGSSFAGSISDKWGRKNSSFLFIGFFLVGSLLETVAGSKSSLSCGRFVSGIGAGACIVNTPVLINEISHPSMKGFLGSLNQVSVNIGILFTQLLAVRWANDAQWRNLLFTGFVIALLNIIGLFFIDESPKWLVKQGKIDQARHVLTHLRGPTVSSSEISEEIDGWLAEINSSYTLLPASSTASVSSASSSPANKVSMLKYLTAPEFKPSRMIVTILMTAQQFCGINSFIFYGVSIISSSFPSHAVALNCAISVVNVVVTYHSATIVDSKGRKPLLMFSVTFMGIAAFITSFTILLNWGTVSVLAIFVYIGSFAIGMGPIPFLVISEVSQLSVTSLAQSYGTGMNWISTFVIGYFFPLVNNLIGGWTFSLFGFVCVLTVIAIKALLPETKGKSGYNEVWGL